MAVSESQKKAQEAWKERNAAKGIREHRLTYHDRDHERFMELAKQSRGKGNE